MSFESVGQPSPNRHRFLRYLIVGGINTLFGFAVYSVLILAGTPLWAALLLANAIGVVFNFVTTGRLVFRTSLKGRLSRFVSAYAAMYLVNLALLHQLRIWIPNEIAAQAVLVLPMAACAYLVMRRFVFRDRFILPPAPRS